jgi:hypothetical protein
MMINRLIGRAQNPKIFIGYRREDAPKTADLLHENLERHFGENSTFMDKETIRGGDRYRKKIQNALATCKVFLAIIGPRWLTISDENNVRRLDKKDDWVRFEIEAALKRDDILVIPVLVKNAALPRPDELPKSLQSLIDEIQAQKVEDDNWDSDVTKLIHIIEENIGRRASRWSDVKWLMAAGAVVALVVGGLMLWNARRNRNGTPAPNVNTITPTNSNAGAITAASPTVTSTALPPANTEGQDKGNQNLTNSNIANTQSNKATTPTPAPARDLTNTSWKYEQTDKSSYVIQFKGDGVFQYWRTKGDFPDHSRTFYGTWKLTGIDVIELIFSPTEPSGKEVCTGKLKNNKIINGRITDSRGLRHDIFWSATEF